MLTLEEAERILIYDMPVIPLYHRDFVYLINPHLNFKVSLSRDRLLLPLSLEEKKMQKEIKTYVKSEKFKHLNKRRKNTMGIWSRKQNEL